MKKTNTQNRNINSKRLSRASMKSVFGGFDLLGWARPVSKSYRKK
ncbi:MAG: hypothetical protein QF645_01195 [Planctomycetota bacterium]|nr:hypothetical protein [Planctomycetota bacterium]